MPKRPYHHGNLRTALLTAAERTLRERGVEQVSLRDLARQVGVSHGAPSRHFRAVKADGPDAGPQAPERPYALLTELIRRGQESGKLQPGAPERLQLIILATFQGIAALVTSRRVPVEQIDALVTDAAALFIRS
jgi:AcrR family transcriptional regulator